MRRQLPRSKKYLLLHNQSTRKISMMCRLRPMPLLVDEEMSALIYKYQLHYDGIVISDGKRS